MSLLECLGFASVAGVLALVYKAYSPKPVYAKISHYSCVIVITEDRWKSRRRIQRELEKMFGCSYATADVRQSLLFLVEENVIKRKDVNVPVLKSLFGKTFTLYSFYKRIPESAEAFRSTPEVVRPQPVTSQ